jgi:ATP-binding cassette subfamily B protein
MIARLLDPLLAEDAEASDSEALQAEAEPLSDAAAPLAVRFRDVTLMGAGRTILDGVDFNLEPGEHLAVVGASGAGKSSLIAAVMGFASPSQGSVSLEVEGAASPPSAALRRRMAWVDPAVRLWNASLLDNLAYASPKPRLDQLGEVLERSRLASLLRKAPEGLLTPLGEGGARLSGGEGQRVRLGRALMQDAVGLALLDEPFRGLDRATRTRLMREARSWWGEKTLIAITHDVAEALAFDKVMVMEAGRIVAFGAPRQLAELDGPFADLLRAEAQTPAWAAESWRRVVVGDGRILLDETHEAEPSPFANPRPSVTPFMRSLAAGAPHVS